MPMLVMLLCVVLGVVYLHMTVAGRRNYAIGGNEEAARFSGLPFDGVKLLTYTLSGLAAGIVALYHTARYNNAQADVGMGIELDVITAVVLGGTSIFGGRGRIIGTILGVVLIHETREFVGWHFHQEEWVKFVLGALLLGAVTLNALFTRRSTQR